MPDWNNNHMNNLPNIDAMAWMFHGRAIGVMNKWVATMSLHAPMFGNRTISLTGVQDDFGNFVEVPNE